MHFISKLLKAVLSALLVWTLLASCALADGTFSAYVKSKNAVIYSSEWLSRRLGSLPNKTVVTVLDYENGVAHIRYKGRTGYARVKDLATVSSIATPVITTQDTRLYSAPSYSSDYVAVEKGVRFNLLTKVNSICCMVEKDGEVGYIHIDSIEKCSAGAPAANESSSGIVYESFRARVKTESIPVYASARTSAKKLGAVAAGTIVNVSAYNSSGWAFIELNGRKGYCQYAGLERIKSSGGYFDDDSLSNEQKVYRFITREMGLSSAAACGIIANIKYESGFKTSSVGDNGRSYGICQWFSARWDRLNSFCENNAYDAATLEGQLRFMAYELERHYPMVLRYLKNSVSDNAQGAYDAAWFFCYHYEGPANRSSASATRASYAKNTVWNRYN